MRHRTNSEIKAYVDGYTACFNQYSECLKNRKSVLDSKKKMEIYLAAVTGVLEATGNATNSDRIRSMTDEELAVFLGNTKAFCCRDRDPSEEFIAEFKIWLKEEAVDNGACSADETSEKVQDE